MSNFEKILKEIKDQCDLIHYEGDLSDIGNEIGKIVGKYITDESGFEKSSFLAGIDHGISTVDGTHH